LSIFFYNFTSITTKYKPIILIQTNFSKTSIHPFQIINTTWKFQLKSSNYHENLLKSKENTLLITCISLKCAPNKFLEFLFFPPSLDNPLFPFIYLLTFVFLLIWCLTHLILTNLPGFLFNFHFFLSFSMSLLRIF